jgi:glycogen phosphorylase
MGNPMFTNLPAEKADDPLAALALDLRWTWNDATDDLWRQLDPELWECTRNPWVILQSVSMDRLHRLLAEPRFREKVQALLEAKRAFGSSAA